MTRIGTRIAQSDGAYVDTFLDINVDASEFGADRQVFSFRGANQTLDLTKALRLRPDRTPAVGETFTYLADDVRRLFYIKCGQSNDYGRGLLANASAVPDSFASQILPNTYPTTEVPEGPAGTGVGAGLWFLYRLLEAGAPYDFATIVGGATGNTNLSDLHVGAGSGLTDGQFFVKIRDADVCGSLDHPTPANQRVSIIQPGDHVVLSLNQAEADVSGGTVSDWAARAEAYLQAIEAYFQCIIIARIIWGLPPTIESGGTQQDHDTAIAQQASMHNPTHPTRPTWYYQYPDSGKKPGDELHASSAAHEAAATTVAQTIALAKGWSS